MTAPRLPACFAMLGMDPAAGLPEGAARALLATLHEAGLFGADRLALLIAALALEIDRTGQGEEAEMVEYLSWVLGHAVGARIGLAAPLRAAVPAGRA